MNINYAEGDTINNIQKITVQEKSKKLIEKRIVYKITKRITDILGAIIGIIVTIPLAVIVFILNLITKDKGPIFYVQNRIGKNGKAFKMYKFRSMELGAEERLQEYLDAHTDECTKRRYEPCRATTIFVQRNRRYWRILSIHNKGETRNNRLMASLRKK